MRYEATGQMDDPRWLWDVVSRATPTTRSLQRRAPCTRSATFRRLARSWLKHVRWSKGRRYGSDFRDVDKTASNDSSIAVDIVSGINNVSPWGATDLAWPRSI